MLYEKSQIVIMIHATVLICILNFVKPCVANLLSEFKEGKFGMPYHPTWVGVWQYEYRGRNLTPPEEVLKIPASLS